MTESENVRVLQLITRFLDGGAETTAENVIEALQNTPDEYDCRLGTGAEYDEDRLHSLEERGIETVVFSTIRHYNSLSAIIAVFAVAWYLKREDIDVVHTHGTEAGIIGPVAGWIARTPVVLHEVHGDPVTEDRNGILNRFLIIAERLCAPLATKIIVKSERIRETYLERDIGNPDQYELIPIGVDIQAFRREGEQATDQSGIESTPTKLLFVGRLAEGKGLSDLIAAIELFEPDDVELDIVGDGPLKTKIREMTEQRGIEDMVTLHGYRDDVPSFMAKSDVLVLPSYREGTPRVIIEARSAELAIVATNIAGIPEMVSDGENGYLVPPGDIQAIRERILEFVKRPSLSQQMGERAPNGIERFERETVKETYRRLYGTLTGHDRT